MATVMKTDPVRENWWTGYKKYGNSEICVFESILNCFRTLSKMQPKRYKESKNVNATHIELNVFLPPLRDDKIRAAIVLPIMPQIATMVCTTPLKFIRRKMDIVGITYIRL